MTRLVTWSTFNKATLRDEMTGFHVAIGSRHTLCREEIPYGATVKEGPVSSVECDDCLREFNAKRNPAKQEAML